MSKIERAKTFVLALANLRFDRSLTADDRGGRSPHDNGRRSVHRSTRRDSTHRSADMDIRNCKTEDNHSRTRDKRQALAHRSAPEHTSRLEGKAPPAPNKPAREDSKQAQRGC
jgi:hypothetical protein